MKGFNKLNEFKKLKFYSRDRQQILEALDLFEQLGYSLVDEDFNSEEAEDEEGLCVWDDGEITEGWLDNDTFEQVTIEDLKKMVGKEEGVLWLNKKTLEEKYLKPCFDFFYDSWWVQVPEGATFATGDKDNFVFRKDGWYYDNHNNEWVKSDATIENLHTHEFVKLFWVKGGVKDNIFTPERLLGCEVLFENRYQSSKGYITSFDSGCSVTLDCGVILTLPNMSRLTFFTEDGDKLTFNEYVKMYYGESNEHI